MREKMASPCERHAMVITDDHTTAAMTKLRGESTI
jgi:hypothetical protein